MPSKFIILALVAGGSAFAQSRFSIYVGSGYGPGYYAPPAYYGVRPHVDTYYGPAYGYRPAWGGGAGYWGEDPDRAHRRSEWQGLRGHQEHEREIYGDGPALWEHQAEERRQLRREQWRESHGDFDAADGPAHGSARDGWYPY